jgi:hypothetical protein
MRAIAAKGLAALFLAFSQLALYAACIGHALQAAVRTAGRTGRRFEWRRRRVAPSSATA